MSPSLNRDELRLALPKGRMQNAVFALLADAGLPVRVGPRAYRPSIGLPDVEVKLLKPQNIVEMLHAGSRDVGFAGADWVAELGADLVELLDTGCDPVRVVAAAPADRADSLAGRPIVVASEYERLTTEWVARRGLDARFVRSYGATEVFPPEDADCIVDNASTGATLIANGLAIVDELMISTTRLYASRAALERPNLRARIDDLSLLVRSVLEARTRVVLELNVSQASLEAVIAVLPCMREATIAPLHGNGGFAVRAAVPRADLPRIIPAVKLHGGTDVVVFSPAQIVP
jgi:ATP phosphoribosyltransferase